jgi:hypothetical protein
VSRSGSSAIICSASDHELRAVPDLRADTTLIVRRSLSRRPAPAIAVLWNCLCGAFLPSRQLDE